MELSGFSLIVITENDKRYSFCKAHRGYLKRIRKIMADLLRSCAQPGV